MRTRGHLLVGNVVCGLALGFSLSRIGFGDYAELNKMFTFSDLRMFLAFAGATVIAALLSLVLLGRPTLTRFHVPWTVVAGSICFGVGWAISGGCPVIPIIQVAEGYLPAVATIGGIVVGVRLCRVFARHVPVDSGSCG